LDLSEENNSIALIAKYYKEINKWDDEYINFKIGQHKANLEIEDTAENIRNSYINSYQEILNSKEEEQRKAHKEAEDKEKRERKEVKESLKNAEYDDPFIAKALPFIFSKDKGEPHWVKEVNKRIKEDPEFKVKFAHWMLNEEDYMNK